MLLNHHDYNDLHAWLHRQPATWLAEQLIAQSNQDLDLLYHLLQCRSNDQADGWSADDLIARFNRVAHPGEFRDERVEWAAMVRIGRFLEQLQPLARQDPPPPGFAAAMARIIMIMYPMYGDWGEGCDWHEQLIAAMHIHAEACRHDPVAATDLPAFLHDLCEVGQSWYMEEAWLREAYGPLASDGGN
jgi:hypothetical protein